MASLCARLQIRFGRQVRKCSPSAGDESKLNGHDQTFFSVATSSYSTHWKEFTSNHFAFASLRVGECEHALCSALRLQCIVFGYWSLQSSIMQSWTDQPEGTATDGDVSPDVDIWWRSFTFGQCITNLWYVSDEPTKTHLLIPCLYPEKWTISKLMAAERVLTYLALSLEWFPHLEALF